MPSHNVANASPSGVLPRLMLLQFQQEFRYESVVNDNYTDGSSDRLPLVTVGRQFFRITALAKASDWLALRNFYIAHVGVPFYFYVLSECQPPYSYDPTGAALQGRYVVVFDSGISETYVMRATKADTGSSNNTSIGSAQLVFSLREVK